MVKVFTLIALFFALFCAYPVAIQSQQAKPDNQTIEQKANQTNDKEKISNPPNSDSVKPLPLQPARPPQDLKKKTSDKSNYSQDASNEWRNVLKSPVNVFTGIIAIFTIFLVIAAGWQVAIVRASIKRELRAYVYPSDTFMFNVADPIPPLPKDYKETGAEITHPGVGPLATMQVKNSGKTPAYEVIGHSDMCIKELPLVSDLPPIKPDKYITKTPIPPKGIITKGFALEKPLTTEEINNLRNGTMAIYAYGTITYKDIFQEKRFTNFRLMYCVHSAVIGIGNMFMICDEGNESN